MVKEASLHFSYASQEPLDLAELAEDVFEWERNISEDQIALHFGCPVALVKGDDVRRIKSFARYAGVEVIRTALPNKPANQNPRAYLKSMINNLAWHDLMHMNYAYALHGTPVPTFISLTENKTESRVLVEEEIFAELAGAPEFTSTPLFLALLDEEKTKEFCLAVHERMLKHLPVSALEPFVPSADEPDKKDPLDGTWAGQVIRRAQSIKNRDSFEEVFSAFVDIQLTRTVALYRNTVAVEYEQKNPPIPHPQRREGESQKEFNARVDEYHRKEKERTDNSYAYRDEKEKTYARICDEIAKNPHPIMVNRARMIFDSVKSNKPNQRIMLDIFLKNIQSFKA